MGDAKTDMADSKTDLNGSAEAENACTSNSRRRNLTLDMREYLLIQKTDLHRKLDKLWNKTQKDIDAAPNTTSLTHMCAMRKALTAHSVEWKDCLSCIVDILDRLNTAEALAEKKCILPDALEKEEICNTTLADLRMRVEEEEERRLLLVENGHSGKDASTQEHDPVVLQQSCGSKTSHKSIRSGSSGKSCHSDISHKSLRSMSSAKSRHSEVTQQSCGSEASHRSLRTVTSARSGQSKISHESQDTVVSKRSSHKSRHTKASRKPSSTRHETDAAILAEARIDAMLAAKAAELAKREEVLRREARKLQAEKEDRELQIKSLRKAFKAEGLAARAKLLQDRYWNPEPDFNPAELGVWDPSQRILDYVQEQNVYVRPLDGVEIKVLNPAAPEFMRPKTTPVFPPAPAPVPAQAYIFSPVTVPVPAQASMLPPVPGPAPAQANMGPAPAHFGSYAAPWNIRRNLADRGVQKFTDRPENYYLWKMTFLEAVRDMNLRAVEQLTLLAEWLGPESTKQAKKFHSANIATPEKALARVWVRLDSRYGSPTAVETALMGQLKNFPQIVAENLEKLWDLADLIETLQAAKEDPELPGLASLDQCTAHLEIQEKLPPALQDEWSKAVAGCKVACQEPASNAEDQLRRLREERTCKVCMDKEVSIVLIPCGHLVVCAECAPNLRRCPICRGTIRDTMRTFMS